MTNLRIELNGKEISLIQHEINMLIVPSLDSVTQINIWDEYEILSYNVLIDKGEVITTNDLLIDYPKGLTQAYISSILDKVSNKNQLLLIDVGGVDYKGFCKIYDLLKEIASSIQAIVLFLELENFAKTFALNEGSSFLLNRDQVSFKKEKDDKTFKLNK